jgi:hypothetical protein
VLLADGAPELWNLFDWHLNERTLGVVPIQLIDARHALEYVGAHSREKGCGSGCAHRKPS